MDSRKVTPEAQAIFEQLLCGEWGGDLPPAPTAAKAETDEQEQDDRDRSSVLYNVEEAVHPHGHVMATLSTKDLKTHHQTNVGNIHGRSEFIVKMQPPVDGRGPWMCYDEARSFESYIAETTDGMERCDLSVLTLHFQEVFGRPTHFPAMISLSISCRQSNI